MARPWEKLPAEKRDISRRHERIVDFYFGPANFSKTKALRMAGYSMPAQYIRLFQHPDIVREIARREAINRERYDVTYEKVVGEIARVAFANIGDYAKVADDGSLVLDFSDIEPGQEMRDVLAAIGEVQVETYMEGKGEDAREVKRFKVKPHNKLQALDQLMRHAGLSRDKTGEALSDLASRISQGLGQLGKRAHVGPPTIDGEVVE